MKTTINPYITFEGNCEEAFNFYKSAFGGEFEYIGRFGEMPAQEGFELPEAYKNKIMHISLPIGGDTYLMGSDSGGEWAPKVVTGNNIAVSILTDNKNEADRLFNELSKGGNISMPMGETFWGAYFGMFTDKFGINWMINYDIPKN